MLYSNKTWNILPIRFQDHWTFFVTCSNNEVFWYQWKLISNSNEFVQSIIISLKFACNMDKKRSFRRWWWCTSLWNQWMTGDALNAKDLIIATVNSNYSELQDLVQLCCYPGYVIESLIGHIIIIGPYFTSLINYLAHKDGGWLTA